MDIRNGIIYFQTEEDEKKANWPCIICEYGPEKHESGKLPKACRDCDSCTFFETYNRNENHKPNNFESQKAFLIPTSERGTTKKITSWYCQKLRDRKKEE